MSTIIIIYNNKYLVSRLLVAFNNILESYNKCSLCCHILLNKSIYGGNIEWIYSGLINTFSSIAWTTPILVSGW